MTIQAIDATASPGGSGSFDVVLVDNGGTFNIEGFSLELSVSSGSGVTFTAADTQTDSTTEPYIFGTYQSAPLPFATDPSGSGMAASFPNTDFVAGDTRRGTSLSTMATRWTWPTSPSRWPPAPSPGL